jgi:opacity protein-like surface antigen
MMKKGFLFGALLALFGMTQIASADEGVIKNTFGIGPRAGFYKSKGAEDGAWYGGVQARFRLGPVLGLEGAVDYRAKETFDFSSAGFNGEVTQRSYPVTASALLFLPVPHFAPYLVGGGGWYYTRTDYSDDMEALGFRDRTDSIFGWHAGGGLEIPFTEHTALNADVRYIFLDNKIGDDGPGGIDTDRKSDGYVATAALMFYF